MLVLESMRAVGRRGLSVTGDCSFERTGIGPSTGPVLGLKSPFPDTFRRFEAVSDSGGGAAGNRNSGMGMGFDKALDDLRCTDTFDDWGLFGPVGSRPNLSGGYEALKSGEDTPL